MSTVTRKQREIRQREELILATARHMLLERGYIGLNMDRIARELEYSKGTIYLHFRSKEDVLIALAIETMEKRISLFERASRFEGLSRERLQAIGMASEIFFQRYPEHFQVEQLIRSASIWEKTSDKRQMVMQQCESCCVAIVGGIVRDAMAAGDLTLPQGLEPEHLVFGLWSAHFGAFSIVSTSNHASLERLQIGDPLRILQANINFMLDGYHWRPLSHEHDYDATRARIAQQIFPEEHFENVDS